MAWRGKHPKDTETQKRQGHSARTDSCEQAAYCCTTNPTLTTTGTAAVWPSGLIGSCSLISAFYLSGVGERLVVRFKEIKCNLSG